MQKSAGGSWEHSPAASPLPAYTFSPSLPSVLRVQAAHETGRRTSGNDLLERDLLRGYQKLLSSCSDFATAVRTSTGTPPGSAQPQGRSGFQNVPAWTPDSLGQQRRTSHMDGILHDTDVNRTRTGYATSLGWDASSPPLRSILRHSSAFSPPRISPSESIGRVDRGDVLPRSDQMPAGPGLRGAPARGQQLSSLEILAAEAYALRLELQEIGMI